MAEVPSAPGKPERTPSRPQTWNEWADFFSKSILATAGLAVTIVTGYVTHIEKARSENEQARLALAQRERDDHADRRQGAAFLADQIPDDPTTNKGQAKLRLAVALCNDPSRIGVDAKVISDLCASVAELGRNNLKSIGAQTTNEARAAVTKGDPNAYVNSAPAVSQNTGLAASESAAPAAESGGWFAVIASLPLDAEGSVKALADQLNAKLVGAGLPPSDVHVYRTKISNSYALTSGRAKSEADARARVRMLRQAGIHDAFAQPNRDWTNADSLR